RFPRLRLGRHLPSPLIERSEARHKCSPRTAEISKGSSRIFLRSPRRSVTVPRVAIFGRRFPENNYERPWGVPRTVVGWSARRRDWPLATTGMLIAHDSQPQFRRSIERNDDGGKGFYGH